MSLELIDIALAERQDHPHLENRVTGKVKAVLTETIDGREQRHELLIPAWIEREAGMDDADIDLALMLKAAKIVGRVRAQLDPTVP
ncbi:hypothetical protein VW35_09390 [Devosia soli]|uniref:Uncharacterized protein n=1 Tax=Devosia soli TaxID=361041 RepID=A0A0F5LAU1_9HYPH|nr:hypothetical protein [Devosia soli]KKB78717.1 hypothetical protein VW35_09390 [Devosia soli]